MTTKPAKPTARRCDNCGKQSPAAISYYRLSTPGKWLCFTCAKKLQRISRKLTNAFRPKE